jgi:hypothetical protein
MASRRSVHLRTACPDQHSRVPLDDGGVWVERLPPQRWSVAPSDGATLCSERLALLRAATAASLNAGSLDLPPTSEPDPLVAEFHQLRAAAGDLHSVTWLAQRRIDQHSNVARALHDLHSAASRDHPAAMASLGVELLHLVETGSDDASLEEFLGMPLGRRERRRVAQFALELLRHPQAAPLQTAKRALALTNILGVPSARIPPNDTSILAADDPVVASMQATVLLAAGANVSTSTLATVLLRAAAHDDLHSIVSLSSLLTVASLPNARWDPSAKPLEPTGSTSTWTDTRLPWHLRVWSDVELRTDIRAFTLDPAVNVDTLWSLVRVRRPPSRDSVLSHPMAPSCLVSEDLLLRIPPPTSIPRHTLTEAATMGDLHAARDAAALLDRLSEAPDCDQHCRTVLARRALRMDLHCARALDSCLHRSLYRIARAPPETSILPLRWSFLREPVRSAERIAEEHAQRSSSPHSLFFVGLAQRARGETCERASLAWDAAINRIHNGQAYLGHLHDQQSPLARANGNETAAAALAGGGGVREPVPGTAAVEGGMVPVSVVKALCPWLPPSMLWRIMVGGRLPPRTSEDDGGDHRALFE